MATNLTDDIHSFSLQWESFTFSVLTSDFGLFQELTSFGTNEMPKLQALPGQIKDFVSNQSALINEAKSNHSKAELNEILDNIKSFCDDKKPYCKDVVAKLDVLRAKVAGDVGDITGELTKLEAEFAVLQQGWNEAMYGCRGCSGVEQTDCAMSAFGDENYDKFIGDGVSISRLKFARDCMSGLVSDVFQLSAVFDELEDTVDDMLDDLDEGFADIPDIEDFLSQLK